MTGTHDKKDDKKSRRQRLRKGAEALIAQIPEDRIKRLEAWFAAWKEGAMFVGGLLAIVGLAVLSVVLLKDGENVLLVQIYSALATFGLTGWAVLRIFGGEDRKAALPLTILGGLAMAAWPFVILAGGYTGDPERGYFLPLLTAAVITVAMVWLLKRDKPLGALTAITLVIGVLIEVLLSLAVSFSLIKDPILGLAVVLGFVAIFAIMTMRVIGGSRGMLVSMVAVTAFVADWWLFGDPHGKPEVGLTIIADGRFDQFFMGVLLLALAALLRRKPTQAIEEQETEERTAIAMPPVSEPPGPEAEPAAAVPPEPTPPPGVDYGFVEDQPEAIKRIWADLTPERRDVIPELLDWQLHHGPAANGSDSYNDALDPGLRERAERCGLTPQQFAGIGGPKAATILAAHADRHGRIPDDVWRQPDSGSVILDRVMGGLDKLVAGRGYTVQKTQSDTGLRPEILSELHITPEEIKEAQQRRVYS